MSRGLAGVVIVRGELDQIPEIAASPESVLVLQDFDLDSEGLPVEPSLRERVQGREGGLVTVNGLFNPVISIQREGWLRLRIVNACSSRFHHLRLEEHPLYVIGTDGGALPAPEERDRVLLTPGERAEVMVRGDRPGGSFRLVGLPYSRGGVGMGPPDMPGELTLATVQYQGEADQTWDLPANLIRVDPLPKPDLRRTFHLGGGMGMGMMAGGMAFTINGQAFDPGRIDTRVRLGTVEDWEFINDSVMDHPMHIHTNPFQVIGADGTPIPAWKDVVLVRARSRQRVRLKFQDFTGVTLYHCHILVHEDFGMMGAVEIQA